MMKHLEAFTPEAIASNHSWLPELEHSALTLESYVQGYLSDPDAWWWTTNDYSSEEGEVVLQRVLEIFARARLPEHEKALGQLGVGPLENMMSDDLLNILSQWMPFSDAMCHALGCVRLEGEPNSVQRRLQAMIFQSRG